MKKRNESEYVFLQIQIKTVASSKYIDKHFIFITERVKIVVKSLKKPGTIQLYYRTVDADLKR